MDLAAEEHFDAVALGLVLPAVQVFAREVLEFVAILKRVVKLGGFVNAHPDFTAIPQVINGCSDLMVDVFGDAGRHARFAVASPVLPLGVAVEVDGIFEIG